MIDYILVIVLLFILFICFFLLTILSDLLPEHNNRLSLPKWLNEIWGKVTEDKVYLSISLLILVVLVFFAVTLLSTIKFEEFIEGIHVELFGIVFDVFFLVLIFNWFNEQGEKKHKINRYKEEIDDIRHLNTDEAKFRKRGIIKRLNGCGVTKIDLQDVDVSYKNRVNSQQISFSNVQIDGSTLFSSNFSNLNMADSSFINIQDHHSDFIKTGLIRAKFYDSHLQGTDFSHAFLHNAKFDGATITGEANFSYSNIKHASFNNVIFGSQVSFDGAEVDKDFFDNVKSWNIKGVDIFNNYTVELDDDEFSVGMFGRARYILKRKSST